MTATKPAPAPSTYRSGHCAAGFHDRCRCDYRTAVCGCGCHDEPGPEPVNVTVRCFFGCDYVARHEEPMDVHDAMEEHYRLAHWGRIRELVGWVTT